MSPFSELGKSLLLFGVVLAALGIFLMIGPKVPRVGRLPGDIVIERKNFQFYFPLGTCLLLSLLLTLLFRLFGRR